MGDHKHVCLRNGTQQPQPSLLSTARARAALESERHGRLVEPTSVEMQGHGIELEPKGPDELASRDVPAFPREERHHRAPWGTRHRRLGAAVQWRGFIMSLPGGLDGSDEPTGPPELKGVCSYTLFWTRSEISRDYPLNLSISLSGGKETNQDSPSNGE